MTDLPKGTVTMLFTDVEGSTQLLERFPTAYARSLTRHDAILRGAVATHQGVIFETIGDAIYAAFARPSDAVAAALDAQIALRREPWGDIGELRVRMAIHTGEVEQRGDHYFGRALYRCARLMATGYGGQALLSSVTASLVRDGLPPGATLRPLGRHRLKDLSDPEEPHQLEHAELIAAFPPLKSLDARPNNLPVEVSTFVGRDREFSEVRHLLDARRVVTLTGPGGIGKTRLALQIAADVIDDFPDGVYLVPLASVSDPGLVLPEIASAVGVREAPGQLLADRVAQHLATAKLLLVLDNFEQVLDAAATVADLLGSTTNLRALVTSRAPLRIAGEQEYPAGPLDLPDPREQLPFDRLAAFDAIRLFAERATEVRPEFAVTAENIRVIAAICGHVDGLPLAIELAAARIRVFDPDSLLRRLGDRLGFLVDGRRDAPARQRTLRGAVAWSHELLGNRERVLFRQLGVFSDGFTLEAAEVVCGSGGAVDVVSTMTSLVDNSLVRRDYSSERLGMFETIREFALEQLAADRDAEAIRRRHAAHFLALVQRGEHASGDERRTLYDRFESDKENIHTAIEWAARANEGDLALRLATAAQPFWWSRGHWQEGIVLLRSALSCPDAAATSPERAAALDALATLCVARGDLSDAQGAFEESVRIWRALGQDAPLAKALNGLGEVHAYRGVYLTAATLMEEALVYARSSNPQAVGDILHNLGAARAFSGDLARGRGLLGEALRERANPVTLLILGEIERMSGEYERSAELNAKALAEFRERRSEFFTAAALATLALTELLRGDPSRARVLCEEGLEIARHLGHQLALALGLDVMAIVEVDQGADEHAARLFGAADALRARTGMAIWEPVRSHAERARARALERLGPAKFGKESNAGRSMPFATDS